MATQRPIFKGPEFQAPEVKPHVTWLEKLASGLATLSPQVKAALITGNRSQPWSTEVGKIN
jgi:hypothetical protein